MHAFGECAFVDDHGDLGVIAREDEALVQWIVDNEIVDRVVVNGDIVARDVTLGVGIRDDHSVGGRCRT